MKIFVDLWDGGKDASETKTNFDRPSTAESDSGPWDFNIEVPEWTMDDVIEWITRIGFSEFVDRFIDKGVDGDLLLSLNKEQVRFSIGIDSTLLLQR